MWLRMARRAENEERQNSRPRETVTIQVVTKVVIAEVLLKEMSREKSSPSARCRSFFLGIQPNRSNVRCESGLARVLRSWRVAACEAENQFFFPVVPFRCCDGANRFVKQQA